MKKTAFEFISLYQVEWTQWNAAKGKRKTDETENGRKDEVENGSSFLLLSYCTFFTKE